MPIIVECIVNDNFKHELIIRFINIFKKLCCYQVFVLIYQHRYHISKLTKKILPYIFNLQNNTRTKKTKNEKKYISPLFLRLFFFVYYHFSHNKDFFFFIVYSTSAPSMYLLNVSLLSFNKYSKDFSSKKMNNHFFKFLFK